MNGAGFSPPRTRGCFFVSSLIEIRYRIVFYQTQHEFHRLTATRVELVALYQVIFGRDRVSQCFDDSLAIHRATSTKPNANRAASATSRNVSASVWSA